MPDVDLTVRKRALRVEMRRIRRAITADPVDRLARSSRIWARIVSIADLGADVLEIENERAQIMLFEGLATEPATEAWFEWCAAHDVDALRAGGRRARPRAWCRAASTRPSSTWWSCPGWRSRQTVGGSARAAVTTTGSCPACAPDCITIGACFAEQVVGDLPIEPHDRRVDHVATDQPMTR